MEKVKALFRNKKFLRVFIPVLVLVIGLGVFAYIKLSDDSIEVEVGKVKYGTVQQFYDTTGTLASGSTEKYYIYEGVVVKEVNVKTGDAVSKGDVLATFDTSAMNKLVSEKSKALKNAREDYNNAVNAQNSASSGASMPTVTAPVTIPTTSASNTTSTTAPQFTEEEIREIIAALQNSNNQNAEGTTQPEATTQAGDASGSEETTSPEQTTVPSTTRPTTTRPQFTEEELAAIANQLQASSNAAGQNVSATMPSFNTNTTGSGLNLGSLMGSSSDLVDSYKKAYENAQAEYDKVVAEKKALDKGWIASGDGKVADIYIKAGEAYVYVEDKSESGDMLSMIMGSSSMGGNSADMSEMLSDMLSGGSTNDAKQGLGMVVDYYDGYKVTFNLGKYDAQTIKVGMPAFVSYTDYEYEAEVTYISPYAESGSSAITTMMGSSSTTTSALPAEVTITNSDNNLIIGFDAKLSILVAEHENVLQLPVEALVIEEGEKFVYIYDKATSTAVKKEVKTGVSSESHYEVLDGLNEGDQVIINSSKVSDGASVYLKK